MGQDPSAIRAEVEQTRERMGDTVEALAYKADVPTRAKENVSGKVNALKEKVTGAADSVNEATPSTGEVKQQARQAKGMAQENPLGLAVGAAAVGFIAGLLIPSTQVEHEKLGEAADQVKDQVKQTAQTAVEHGKEAVQDAAQAAGEAAKEAGQEHAEQAKSDVQDQARFAKEQVGS